MIVTAVVAILGLGALLGMVFLAGPAYRHAQQGAAAG
jgi:hypothetical protein